MRTKNSKIISKKQPQRKGFSLPEVMVGIAILAGVIVASTNLLITTSRSNTLTADNTTAFYLAQEGLELTRNLRDSNWLQGINWTGLQGTSPLLTKSSIEEGTYIIENHFPDQILSTKKGTKSKNELQRHAPWGFQKIKCEFKNDQLTGPECSKTNLIIQKDNQLGTTYIHNKNILTLATEQPNKSKFNRLIQIEQGSHEDPKLQKMIYKIKSIVTWEENGSLKNLTLETQISDWKQGPI